MSDPTHHDQHDAAQSPEAERRRQPGDGNATAGLEHVQPKAAAPMSFAERVVAQFRAQEPAAWLNASPLERFQAKEAAYQEQCRLVMQMHRNSLGPLQYAAQNSAPFFEADALQYADGPAPSQQTGPKTTSDVKRVAATGLEGATPGMPHQQQIQASFGKHDISNVQASVGGQAEKANAQLGSLAYASGDKISFRGQPDLFTAAHEAAHIVQQRAGVNLKSGIGEVGDTYEQHADAVASLVVQGKSAEALLDQKAPSTPSKTTSDANPVQRKKDEKTPEPVSKQGDKKEMNADAFPLEGSTVSEKCGMLVEHVYECQKKILRNFSLGVRQFFRGLANANSPVDFKILNILRSVATTAMGGFVGGITSQLPLLGQALTLVNAVKSELDRLQSARAGLATFNDLANRVGEIEKVYDVLVANHHTVKSKVMQELFKQTGQVDERKSASGDKATFLRKLDAADKDARSSLLRYNVDHFAGAVAEQWVESSRQENPDNRLSDTGAAVIRAKIKIRGGLPSVEVVGNSATIEATDASGVAASLNRDMASNNKTLKDLKIWKHVYFQVVDEGTLYDATQSSVKFVYKDDNQFFRHSLKTTDATALGTVTKHFGAGQRAGIEEILSMIKRVKG